MVRRRTYKQRTEKMMTRPKWKMLAMPSAKHRMKQRTPVLRRTLAV